MLSTAGYLITKSLSFPRWRMQTTASLRKQSREVASKHPSGTHLVCDNCSRRDAGCPYPQPGSEAPTGHDWQLNGPLGTAEFHGGVPTAGVDRGLAMCQALLACLPCITLTHSHPGDRSQLSWPHFTEDGHAARACATCPRDPGCPGAGQDLSLIHISEPTRH